MYGPGSFKKNGVGKKKKKKHNNEIYPQLMVSGIPDHFLSMVRNTHVPTLCMSSTEMRFSTFQLLFLSIVLQ